jgi:thiamine pyrophosphate-dependent acetolactate synthase large subunit-like protein
VHPTKERVVMKRADCLVKLAEIVREDDLVVVALGGTWDEWDAARRSDANFFNSAMGSNVPLALGLSLALPHRRVVLLDTEGCILMTLGALCTLANHQPPNLHVFVFDNGVYQATGGQPTATAGKANIAALARAAGIAQAIEVDAPEPFSAAALAALNGPGLTFIVARVEPHKGPRAERWEDHVENKYRFVRYIESTEGARILTH